MLEDARELLYRMSSLRYREFVPTTMRGIGRKTEGIKTRERDYSKGQNKQRMGEVEMQRRINRKKQGGGGGRDQERRTT